jgi:HYR domain
MKRRISTRLAMAIGALLLLMPGLGILLHSVEAAGGTVIVSPATQASTGWVMLQGIFGEKGPDTGTQTYVQGPGTPPLGTGSLQIMIGSNNDWSEAVGYTNLNGISIGSTSLTELSYQTYVQQASNASQDFFLILVVDTNGDQTADDFLFFYPANQQGCSDDAPPQHPITQGVWQAPWDARNGVWVSAFGLCNAQNSCGTANDPKTLSEYLKCFPNARIINSDNGTKDPSDDTPGLIIGYGGATVSANFIGYLDNVRVGVSGMTTAFDFDPNCMITCPANITQSNDPNQCGAVVNYPAPTTSGGCGTVTCSPASGSFFPKGTTTVSCDASGTAANPDCTFTVTVNDTQPPTITCPANQTSTAAQTCPFSNTATVSFPPPTASDNCPGVTTQCTPASGSTFPVGTSTVTCTATDTSGNTATCSFTVAVFSGCLQDDSNPANVVLFNALTGDYRFCCNGTAFTGRGTVAVRGCTVEITHYTADRRVLIKADFSARAGTASLQVPPGTTRCTITDRNTSNNTCQCGSGGALAQPK